MSNVIRDRLYTMTFAFSPNFEQVLLLLKSTPPWQKGKWNAPGGKVEFGESEVEGAVREMLEETNLIINAFNMLFILRFSCECDESIHEVAVYGTILPLKQLKLAKGESKEPVKLFSLNSINSVPTVGYVEALLSLTIGRMNQVYERSQP